MDIKIGDKVFYYERGSGVKCGIVENIYGTNWKYYLMNNSEKYIYEYEITKFSGEECFNEIKERETNNYRVKKYNYLFLQWKKDGLYLRSVKINPTKKLDISKKMLEEFPDVCDYASNLLVLIKNYNVKTKQVESAFSSCYLNMGKMKFETDFKNWVRTKDFAENKEWKIDVDTDIDAISKEIGKDIKYLLGDIYYRHSCYYFRRLLEGYDQDEKLKSLYNKFDLRVYCLAKKDLCSNGDEVLF